jgi:hypothetical protein
MAAKHKRTVIDPLFASTPPAVKALANTAAKAIRQDERQKWWAVNKPKQ